MTGNHFFAASETGYELIEEYAEEFGDLIARMDLELGTLLDRLEEMHGHWEGELYDNFARSVKRKLSEIAGELDRASALKSVLDAYAVAVREQVDTLAEAGEK